MGQVDDRTRALLDAAVALASELSLPVVLQRIVDLAARLTDARYGALGVLGPDGRITEFVTTGVTPEERAAIGRIPEGHGVLGVLIENARPLRLTNIAEHPRSVGFPMNHPPMRSFLGAPVKAHGRVFGNIYLTEKRTAAEFTAEDEAALVHLATLAGVAVANAYVYEEAQRRERWLEAVREIALAILSGAPLNEVLRLIARTARDLVGADLATITTPGSKESLVVRVAEGAYADELRGQTMPVEGSVSGDVIRGARPLLVPDLSADQRAYQPAVRLGHMGPGLFVPLVAQGETFGTLAVINVRGRAPFAEEHVRFVQTFADQASLALQYAQAQRELQRLAVLEDRERIAKELHDGAIQSLFAVGMTLQATAQLSGKGEVVERIEGAVDELDRVIQDLRNYIYDLRPALLDKRELDEALERLARDFEDRTGVVTVVDVDPRTAAELHDHAAEVVQLAREALSNVGRHAQARTCRLTLRRGEEGALLEVDDDGRGFDPASLDGSGQGLRNMRERAAALGGALEVSSAPGSGTAVRVTIPG